MKKSLKFIIPLFIVIVAIGVVTWLNKDNITNFIREKQIANLIEMSQEYVSKNEDSRETDIFSKVNKYDFIDAGYIFVNDNNEVALLVSYNEKCYIKTYSENDIEKLNGDTNCILKFLNGLYFDDVVSGTVESEASLIVSAINLYCVMDTDNCSSRENIIENFDEIVPSTVYFDSENIKKLTFADKKVEKLELAYGSRLYVYDGKTNKITTEENKYENDVEIQPEEQPSGNITSSEKSNIKMIFTGINNYCATADMKYQLTGQTNPCSDGVTIDEVSTMVELGNYEVANVEMNGNSVKNITVLINGKTIYYDGKEYALK